MIKQLVKDYFKHNSYVFIGFYKLLFLFNHLLPHLIFGDEYLIKKKYRKTFGREINLESPKRLTEKMQWLKLNVRDDFQTLCADKLRVRDYYSENFGKEYLVPLLSKFDNWKDIKEENFPDTPCVLKANTGCGTYKIIHNKKNVDWQLLRNQAKLWVDLNHYYRSQEWQYKNIQPCYIVEKLLLTRDGKLPNDYKLHYIEGDLKFIHCNIDREGKDYKNYYTPKWEPADFSWLRKDAQLGYVRNDEISKPVTLSKMIEIGNTIAKNYKYVRVDFYDVDGELYFGEITLYHGSGLNVFNPDKFDLEYGKYLDLDK